MRRSGNLQQKITARAGIYFGLDSRSRIGRPGLNNNAEVTMSKSHGSRAKGVRELALDHSPSKLPEPDFTHRFF
jgi:hypothetical protein